MNILILSLALLIGISACIIEAYFIITYVRSGFVKYPPFILSFGRAKNIVIKEAEKFLNQQKDPIKVVDLGCGSGSLLLPLAKKFPQHHFIGYDWDKIPYLIAKYRTKKIKNISIYNCDFMKQNYTEAKLLLCYTGPSLKEELGQKLHNEIPSGTLIISEAFELSHIPLKEIISAPTLKMPIKIFLYQK